MKTSLKKHLNEWIKREGYVSYDQVREYCDIHYYRMETARRKLRELTSKKYKVPLVEAVTKRGVIIGWKWIGTDPVLIEWRKTRIHQKKLI